MVKLVVKGVKMQCPEDISNALHYVKIFIRDTMRQQKEQHGNESVIMDYKVYGKVGKRGVDIMADRLVFVEELKNKLITKGFSVDHIIDFCVDFFENEKKRSGV